MAVGGPARSTLNLPFLNSARNARQLPEVGPVAYRWVVFVILAVIYLLVYFHRQALAVLAVDLMHSLRINGAWMGWISAAYLIPYALMQLPAGALVRRWGPRLVLEASLGLAVLGSLWLALAMGPVAALWGRILVGLGAGAVLVGLLEIIAQWFRQSRFVTMVGWLLAVGGLGVFSGGGPLAHLDHLVGWRASFMVIAAVSGGLALCLWLFTRDRPVQMGFPPVEPRPLPPAGQEGTGAPVNMGAVLANPRFWPPAIWGFCTLAVFISLGGLWGGPYLMHVHGLSKVQTGHILSMQALGMMLGSPLLAYLAGRGFGSRRRVLLATSALLVAWCSLMVLAPAALSVAGLYAWFAGLGLLTMAAAPLALTLARENVPPAASPLATGACNFFFIIGGALMQPVVGWLLDAHGGGAYTAAHFSASFKLYWVLTLVALGAALLVREDTPRSGRTPA